MLERFRAFMYGRNGVDGLNIALSILYLVLSLVLPNNYFINLISLIPLGFALFRTFSKNLATRRAENDWFMRHFNKVRTTFTKWNNRLKDTTHCYVKCKNCRQTLRLPKGRGKLQVTCPKCGHRFAKKT